MGNVVKYDMIVEFFLVDGLKLGMSVDVEIVFDVYCDVVVVLVVVVVEIKEV